MASEVCRSWSRSSRTDPISLLSHHISPTFRLQVRLVRRLATPRETLKAELQYRSTSKHTSNFEKILTHRKQLWVLTRTHRVPREQ